MFEGKTAIVTGGSSGIGAVIARLLVQQGANVAIVASSNIEKARQVCKALEHAAGRCAPFAADVSSDEAIARLFDEVERDLQSPDILVNAAGVFYATPVGETPAVDAHRLIDINVKGTWNCIQHAAPRMKRRGGGKILNFSSVAGFAVGVKGFALYCASKAAISAITRVAGAELAPFKINVNALAPGNTATPMNEAVRTDPAHAQALENFRLVTPSGVPFSQPEEIAAAAMFLLSPQARAVHGATWLVDEGLSAAAL
ncbi:MAG TPA: SDR family oxidoreductase [Steroidobacter sp.]|uniref:SDR family NAD(P)-dependent oxidoreductase n=1 Tax=Steroidobacter sp. TaxID=1978227 RepID=UPI002ED7C753